MAGILQYLRNINKMFLLFNIINIGNTLFVNNVVEGMRQFNKGFPYRQIESNLVQQPDSSLNADQCEAACLANEKCVGWELCSPIGDGCNGCYMVTNRPEVIDREGWWAGLIDERAAVLPEGLPPIQMPE